MSLQNIKKLKADKGFTIVELLIVIVIIGILAAITIVAYNGIQNRGKLSAAQATANSAIKKAEAYNAVNSSYPTTAAQFDGTAESKITGSGIKFITTAPGTGNGSDSILYQACTAPTTLQGTRVQYYDFVAGSNAYSYGGSISAANQASCTTWSTAFAAS
ncbi:type II secretion system protein G [compost metagenome]